MEEQYKECPNCHNMVDKDDTQCPYCLTSLNFINTSKFLSNFFPEYKSPYWNSNFTTKYDNEQISIENLEENEEYNQTRNTNSPYLIQSILEIEKNFQEIKRNIDDKRIIIIIIGLALIPLIFWLNSVFEEYQAYLTWK